MEETPEINGRQNFLQAFSHFLLTSQTRRVKETGALTPDS